MALLNDYYQPQYEITIPNCYWKIEIYNGISGGKTSIRVTLNCFKNKEIADTNIGQYANFNFNFVPDISDGSPNFITQAYNYAKTLPEFINAVGA
jgi:hypothetical protein